MERERFSSRLGFILVSAGCAIGLGNVWKFPYVTGRYGGGVFVLFYLAFLFLLGVPIMIMELAVGRASQRSVAQSFDVLEPKNSKWHVFKFFGMAGNYLLMMFYTTVAGWMVLYFFKCLLGEFEGKGPAGVSSVFQEMKASPGVMAAAMAFVVILCFGLCAVGFQKGVEKVTKGMMLGLLGLMALLVFRCVTLPGAGEGFRFYLLPDFGRLVEQGISQTVFMAMGQAFFTLSVGMGSMAIFGSYTGKERSLSGEAVSITLLDTGVALMAGLIIFPACFAFGVSPGAGPGLIFETLPNVFSSMPGGRLWGALFFLFLTFASLSTIIAVFENIISFAIDLTGCGRKKAALLNCIALLVLSLPCVFGFNLLASFEPMGADSTVMELEDFIISGNLQPLGSLVYLFFCVSRYGWGWKNFLAEANAGKGLGLSGKLRWYFAFVMPVIIVMIFLQGYAALFR